MEYENERILKLIFPNGVPAHLQSDPAAVQAYLFKLGTYKVDQLKQEQTHLADEHRAVVEQTQDLAISNYTTFIQTSECSKHIFTEFNATEQQLDSLIERLPDLTERCDRFVAASAEINTARRLNTLTLRRNAQLLEILELPQLMDTCIRHGKYEEALELAAYVQRLGARHATIPVINNIVAAIEASWHTMLQQLLAQLRADLQLPKCLQVVGYLRRMQAFSAAELRLVFLQSRDAWLTRILAAIPSADPLHHLTKTIELTRVNLFTILTQYKATFADADVAAAAAADVTGVDSVSLSVGADVDASSHGAHMFHAWLTAKIDTFLGTLEADLLAGSASIDSIDTVLGQCMYFGLSFSRVGVDFRGLMAPIFAKVILGKFSGAVQLTQQQFEADMERFTLINKLATGSSSTSSGVNATTVAAVGASDADTAGPLLPPDSLLDFQPLAIFCNGLLGALNDLRPCAPVALAQQVTAVLQAALAGAARAVHNFHRQEQQAFGAVERANFQRLAACVCSDLVPFVQRCVHEVFPAAVMQAQLGLSAVQLQKEALTQLRVADIVRPLAGMMPAPRVELVAVPQAPKVEVDEVVVRMVDGEKKEVIVAAEVSDHVKQNVAVEVADPVKENV